MLHLNGQPPPPSTLFAKVPSELWVKQIIPHLESCDRRQLRLVSKSLCAFVTGAKVRGENEDPRRTYKQQLIERFRSEADLYFSEVQ